MKVAIDCRKFGDFGIGTTIRGILEGLSNLPDSEIEYLILGPQSIAGRLPGSPRFQFVQEDSPHYSVRELVRTGNAAQRHGADLLHVPHYITPFTRLPLVTTIHDLIHLRTPAGDLPIGGRLYARWMLGRAAKRSARIVTVSHAVKREIHQQFPGVEDGKVAVIPNGVPEPGQTPVPFESRDDFILFVGNDKTHKNVDRLVAAFERVHQQFQNLSLVLVGSPFERFRTTAGVRTPGFVSDDELTALYRSATALVQPSLMEGFGLPVAEAMSHGTPVIVSAIPSLLEVAGDAAIPIDEPLDVGSIVTTLTTTLQDEELRRRSGSRGPQIAGRFRWSTAAKLLVDLWTDVSSRE